MNVKKIIVYAGAWLIMSIGGCSRFLEVNPVGRTTIPVLFSDMDGIRAAMYGAYSMTYMYYSRYFSIYPELAGNTLSMDVQRLDETERELYNFNARQESTTGSIIWIWSDIYVALSNINNALFYLPSLEEKFPGYRSELQYYKAELLFLRALCHFDLMRVYAQPYNYTPDASHLGIPILRQTPGPDDPVSRSTVKEVYDFVINDLQEAHTIFSDNQLAIRPANLKAFFASVDAVNGLLSRVYLYKGDWDNCIAHSGEVINRIPLAQGDSYIAMFRQQTGVDPETVFRLNGLDKGSSLPGFYSFLTVRQENGTTTTTIPVAETSETFISLFTNPEDIRRRLIDTLETQVGGSVVRQYFTNKFNVEQTSGDANKQYYNSFVLRVSELYLNRAEAYLRKGRLGEAADDLKQIIARAVQKPVTVINVSDRDAQELDKLIRDERIRELCFEGHRFFDVARRGESLVRDDRSSAQVKELSYPDYRFVLPIPLRELQANEHMLPNPGFN